jgi:trans-cinnamate 4-monooxygenase
MWEEKMDLVVHELKRDERVRTKGLVIRKHLPLMLYNIKYPK